MAALSAVSPPSCPLLLQRTASSSVIRAALLPQRQQRRPRQAGVAVRCSSTSRQQETSTTTTTSTRQVNTATPSSAGVVQGVVSLLTESLRLLGVGRTDYERISAAAPDADAPPPVPGDVAAVLQRVQADFERSYFITGVIDGGIYDPQCTFKDPTVSFSGLDLWRRNLALLVPFLIEPRVQLLGLRDLGLQDQQQQQRPGPDSSSSSSRRQLEADWTLQATLALPWRPFVDVLGRTIYTLNADQNQIEEHVEFWDISPVQALLQVVTPGGQRSRQRSQS